MKTKIVVKPFALSSPFPHTTKAQGFILPAVIVVASLSGLSQPVRDFLRHRHRRCAVVLSMALRRREYSG